MNEDFEESYDEQDNDELQDAIDNVKDKKRKLKDDIDKYKESKNRNRPSNPKEEVQKAKEFNDTLKSQNLARTNSEVAKTSVEATTNSVNAANAANAGASATATGTGATAAGTGAAAAGSGAAATGGTVAAVNATTLEIPGVNIAVIIVDIVLLVIALLSLGYALLKKIDKNAEENGVYFKGIRRLLYISPIGIPILIIALIMLLLTQADTTSKVNFMKEAIACVESSNTCTDFMNMGDTTIEALGKPLIKATDVELANFVVQYVIAENKYFSSNGSIISDLSQELNKLGEGLDDQSTFGQVEQIFGEIVEKTPLQDVRYAWNLFKWLRLEKQVFNKIDWYRAYTESTYTFSPAQSTKTWLETKYNGTPNIGGDTVKREALTLPQPSLSTAWLKTPAGISIDEAISAAKNYIPSYIELYATYVGTGNFKLTNDLYNYYLSDNYQLEITLYMLTTVISKEKIQRPGETVTTYQVTMGGQTTELTEDEFYEAIDSGEQGIFAKLKDAISDFINDVKAKVESVLEKLKEELGFYITAETNYVPIVTKGNAFKYQVNQEYDILTSKTTELVENAEQLKIEPSEKYTFKYTETLDNGKKVNNKAVYEINTIMPIDYKITTWTNKLVYSADATKITEYEQTNRYAQCFVDMVQSNGYNYSLADVTIVIDILETSYNEEYKLTGASIDYSALPEGQFGWPVPANKVVSAIFGYTTWYGDEHLGIDIWSVDANGELSASLALIKTIDIVAAQSGTVTKAYDGGCADGDRVSAMCGGGYGNYVRIDHDNGYSTIYAHLSPGTIAVSEGQNVVAGQYLGKMGSSGNSSGTHLHYEIRFNDTRIDPLSQYVVEPYNYSLPYSQRNNYAITMANPYRVVFDI